MVRQLLSRGRQQGDIWLWRIPMSSYYPSTLKFKELFSKLSHGFRRVVYKWARRQLSPAPLALFKTGFKQGQLPDMRPVGNSRVIGWFAQSNNVAHITIGNSRPVCTRLCTRARCNCAIEPEAIYGHGFMMGLQRAIMCQLQMQEKRRVARRRRIACSARI
jgi:hypothetical protein